MPLNPEMVGEEWDSGARSWSSDSSLLYALGVGAGSDGVVLARELPFVTENSIDVQQRALPTMAVVLATAVNGPSFGTYELSQILHAEQSIELFDELPVQGSGATVSRVLEMRDKGSDALIVTETVLKEAATDRPLAAARSTIFVRGGGGFGGERGAAGAWHAPDRPADHVVDYDTAAQQPFVYRLSGDRNPLHSDPKFAAKAGFERPILHGLCTYGMSGRALLHAVAGSDPSRFGALSARFASPVIPGERLSIHIWTTTDATLFQTKVGDRVVLDRGVFAER